MSVSLFDLTGKQALITGGTQGIGAALAEGLGQAGVTLVINARNEEKLAAFVGHLDFPDLFTDLFHAGYEGWLSVEILPIPSPDVAARQTAEFLLPLVRAYNQQRVAVA
ncbi:MAG: SDR family NAD(P)-dependent oxidoreductase [Cytophagaceae bacterium]|nr:SDR family NAD(P)-dependent oxidoreductase [Cytophagaceae bacterium]